MNRARSAFAAIGWPLVVSAVPGARPSAAVLAWPIAAGAVTVLVGALAATHRSGSAVAGRRLRTLALPVRSGLGRASPVADRRHSAVSGRGLAWAAWPAMWLVGGTGLALAWAAAVVGGGWWWPRRRARRRSAAVAAAVPELIDLFALAASAGVPVAPAVAVVAERAPPSVQAAVRAAAEQIELGERVDAALRSLGDHLGPRGEPLVAALADAARTGAPLLPVLIAVGAVAHDERQRAGEEAARRLPVTLLFPLACCILPAAVLLALVPVLVVSLGSLHP